MKRILTIMLALMMIMTLVVGCGPTPAPETDGADSANPVSEEYTDGTEKTTLVVGLDDQFPPMGFRDENNNLVGFDIDLATAAAERAGMTVELTPIDWTTKELELNGDKVDVLWNGLTITPARQEAMLLSTPYITNAQVVIVKADSGITTLAQLEGKVVALQDTSSADEAFAAIEVSQKVAELVKAQDNVSILNDLKIGRVDAVVIDKVVAEYYLSTEEEGTLAILTEQLADEEYGIAFKKGNDELADKILSAVQEMVDDGTAAEISQKWFGEDRIVFSYAK